jgi:hypothetical protein
LYIFQLPAINGFLGTLVSLGSGQGPVSIALAGKGKLPLPEPKSLADNPGIVTCQKAILVLRIQSDYNQKTKISSQPAGPDLPADRRRPPGPASWTDWSEFVILTFLFSKNKPVLRRPG